MKIVTVIIPTYNSEKSIERAIRSVLNQQGIGIYFDIEVLICDDCSTDKTIEICKRYPVKIFINEKNSGGPNKGRNVGIRNATGDCIAFLDHDDEWLPFKLRQQYDQIKANYEFIYSSAIKKLESQE